MSPNSGSSPHLQPDDLRRRVADLETKVVSMESDLAICKTAMDLSKRNSTDLTELAEQGDEAIRRRTLFLMGQHVRESMDPPPRTDSKQDKTSLSMAIGAGIGMAIGAAAGAYTTVKHFFGG